MVFDLEKYMREQGGSLNYSIVCGDETRMMPARDDAEAERIAAALFPDRGTGSWVKSTGKLCFVLTWKPS